MELWARKGNNKSACREQDLEGKQPSRSVRPKSAKEPIYSDSTHSSSSSIESKDGKKDVKVLGAKPAKADRDKLREDSGHSIMDLNCAIQSMKSNKASSDDKGPKIIASHLFSQETVHQIMRDALIAITRSCFPHHFTLSSDEVVFEALRNAQKPPGDTPSLEDRSRG